MNLGATISSTANLGTTIIRRGHQSQTNVGGAGNSTSLYVDILPNRVYQVVITGNQGKQITKGLEFLEISTVLKDSLVKQQFSAETAKQQASFNVKEKEREITVLNKNKELQQQNFKSNSCSYLVPHLLRCFR